MSWRTILLTTVGISFSIASVLCGDLIQGSRTTAQMFGFMFLSIGLMVAAILMVAIATMLDQNEREAKDKRIKRVPTHNNAWRGDC